MMLISLKYEGVQSTIYSILKYPLSKIGNFHTVISNQDNQKIDLLIMLIQINDVERFSQRKLRFISSLSQHSLMKIKISNLKM